MAKKNLPAVLNSVVTVDSLYDPVRESAANGLTIIFFKSTARSYGLVYEAAKRAKAFKEVTWEKKAAFGVSFDLRDKVEMSRAVLILRETSRWKGTLVFVDGGLMDYVQAEQTSRTIECYAASLKCDNADAYCLESRNVGELSMSIQISLSPSSKQKKSPVVIFPCRLVAQRSDLIYPSTGVSLPDQVQALSVKIGCHFCPNFDKKKSKLVDASEAPEKRYWT